MRLGVVVALVALLSEGCSPQPVGAIVTDAPREEWHEGESLSLGHDNLDTLTLYNLGVVARVEVASAKESMTLVVGCASPSGASYRSEVVLLAEKGQRGGSFKEYRGRWIEQATLAERGEYIFSVTPKEELQGVWNVGVTIEEAK